MKLSIIIPVYNEVKYIRRCLDSVYANEDVEVLVVDDGSTDGTSDILEEYKDRFTILRPTMSNFGVSWARNAGLLNASGDYITFLDSDDEMSENGIGVMLACVDLGLEKQFDLIQFNHWRVGGDGKQQMKFFNQAGWYTLDKLPSKWVLCWNKIYRRDFLREHDIKFPWNIGFEEDRIFNLLCLEHTDKIVNYAVGTVIKHNDNKESICHTKTREKVFGISNELTELLKQGQKPELERVIRKNLVDCWDSRHARQLFGGDV